MNGAAELRQPAAQAALVAETASQGAGDDPEELQVANAGQFEALEGIDFEEPSREVVVQWVPGEGEEIGDASWPSSSSASAEDDEGWLTPASTGDDEVEINGESDGSLS